MNCIQAKIKKNLASSYGYKLVCTDDKFSKPSEWYLGENFIKSMSEGSKYCRDMMK